MNWFLYDRDLRHEKCSGSCQRSMMDNFSENTQPLTIFAKKTYHRHCVKSVRIRSYSGPHFSRIFTHSDWIRKDTPSLSVFSLNSGKCEENADQNNSEYRHFLRSEIFGRVIHTSKHDIEEIMKFSIKDFFSKCD